MSNHHHSQPVNYSPLCESIEELIPAYSIGATDPDETQLVETLLPFCESARALLNEYQSMTDSLLHLVPETDDPPSVAGLMQRVAAYEQEQVAIKTERATRATSQEMTTQPRLVTQPEPSTTVVQMPRSSNRLLLTLVAASILVLAGVTLYWTNQVMQLQREQNDLIALLAAAPATTNEVDPPPARIALSGPNHHRELLPAEDVAAGASARFVWNAEDQVGAVFATGLPPLPDDQVYQVWVVTLEGESLSLGTFEINEDGDGALVFAADEPIQDYTHIGISTEQRGGSLTPTTPHLVIGVI